MNNAKAGTGLLLTIGLICFAGTAHGAGQYLKLDYPASTATNELQVAVTYMLWIPEGVKTLLDDIAPRTPKAATADPKSFVDMSFVQELEASGFIKQLYKR